MRVSILCLVLFAAACSGCPSRTTHTAGRDGEEPRLRVRLQEIASGLTAPSVLAFPQDGRILVADQAGLIRVRTPEGELLEEPFLDLRDRMVQLRERFDERGLLGLALHPRFSENRHLFVYYSAPLRSGGPEGWDHTSHVSRFTVSSDPNRADAGSEKIVLQIDQPEANHNAGQIVFGPDGMLYIPLGDGGGANDTGRHHPPQGNGQELSTLLGTILRIDVDAGDPYSIPEDNPFVGRDGRDEIFAFGLRNPYRITFDGARLLSGDVGQELWEEVNVIESGGNYGWNLREGLDCFDPANPGSPPPTCPRTDARGEPLIDPVLQYRNTRHGGIGTAIIGGYVYRGDELPALSGRYVFGDWSRDFTRADGTLFAARTEPGDDGLWPFDRLHIEGRPDGRLGEYVLAFARGPEEELYLLTSAHTGPTGSTGRVFRLAAAD